ncbi:hypothetical protein DBR11_00780 [Pedobacter sp. HMWF019]|uniref:Shedu anti-phage system protein SduA domain-containing protein n=1 Tax=Pedobacter sp. HMWF019 TaxID=2056856 RepID=UPI000D342316|nr:Shedu anti-phage system protein SduA domain-containing protein [Pedobacter sp. HMWF019]PTT03977.1 hypothetical protein DBR11_00780 [Pedobacter sp. HMWF019]
MLNINELTRFLSFKIAEEYWQPLATYLKEHEVLNDTFTKFLINPEKIIIYLGKNHMGIEYLGDPQGSLDSWELKIQLVDYTTATNELIDNIIGFEYDDSSSHKFRMPLPPFTEDLILPTNRGMDKLGELKWNFGAQNGIIGLNTCGVGTTTGSFHRIVNGLFFDAGPLGLKTRHIKWLDLLPLTLDDSHPQQDELKINMGYLKGLVEHDAQYKYPLPATADYKYNKLPQINRFIELIADRNNSETNITSFLEKPENQFILSMGFLGKKIHPQLEFQWQSANLPCIKPDFMIEKPNGFADIIEFKLPYLKGETVVGKVNRETFSAEINAYISQTRKYKTYFDDPNNRAWAKENYNIQVHYPKRILVVGRRVDFKTDEWRDIINDYRDIEIMTFDDLIDGVVAQFYM